MRHSLISRLAPMSLLIALGCGSGSSAPLAPSPEGQDVPRRTNGASRRASPSNPVLAQTPVTAPVEPVEVVPEAPPFATLCADASLPRAGVETMRALSALGGQPLPEQTPWNAGADCAALEATLASMTWVDLRGRGLSDLRPLTVFRQARYIDLGSNRIEKLDGISPLVNLKSLTLKDNKISDLLPLSTLSSLEHLSLENNKVESLRHLASLKSIRRLYVSSNRIGDLEPLRGVDALVELQADRNAIADVRPLADLDTLSIVSLSDNAISDVTFLSGLRSVRHVNVARNDIESIAGVEPLPELETLNVSDNVIVDLRPLARPDEAGTGLAFKQLRTLVVSNTLVKDLAPLKPLATLEYLDASGTPAGGDKQCPLASAHFCQF